MIDTDKYEGHTPAPWYFWCGGVSTGPAASGKDITKSKVNGKLIADAPLILQALIDEQAEVKRLRKAIEKWEDEWCKLGDYISHYDNKMYEAIDEDIGWAE